MSGLVKEFFDFIEQQGLSLVEPPVGEGSCEIDGVQYGWSWFEKDLEELKRTHENAIWTVIEGDEDDDGNTLFVTHNYHRANRVFYLVTDKPYTPKKGELVRFYTFQRRK